MSVEVETDPAFNPGKPKILFRGTYGSGAFGNDQWTVRDIHPSTKKFLMMKPLPTTAAQSIEEEETAVAQPKIIVVVNWFEELRERVPTH